MVDFKFSVVTAGCCFPVVYGVKVSLSFRGLPRNKPTCSKNLFRLHHRDNKEYYYSVPPNTDVRTVFYKNESIEQGLERQTKQK